MPGAIRIRRLQTIGDREIQGLSDVLIDCVEGGASVSFMLPMTRAKADTFWRGAAAGVARAASAWCLPPRTRRDAIVGTVQIILAQPENQPHRGDLAKMLVHRRARRRGIGAQPCSWPPSAARSTRGKTLLVLDTASDDAERLYARQWLAAVRADSELRACCPTAGRARRPDFFKSLRDWSGGTFAAVIPAGDSSAPAPRAPGDRRDWRASRGSRSGCSRRRRGAARACPRPSPPRRSRATGAGTPASRDVP